MKLTGKIQTDFEKWYIEEYKKITSHSTILNDIRFINFYEQKLDEQWGVYQSFADSVDFDLVTFRWHNKFSASVYENNYKGLFDQMVWSNDKSKQREQARTKTIENFIRIYNEK